MKKVLIPLFCMLPGIAGSQSLPPDVISTGGPVELTRRLVPEKPTIFVFLKPSSSLERAFLAQLQSSAKGKVGFGIVQLRTGAEPVATQYSIQETPTALVYDRRGRLVTRSSDPAEIHAAVQKAAQVMRIDWAEEGTPAFVEAEKAIGRKLTAGILRTMSLRPEYLAYIDGVANIAHFRDGFLKRRVKEMIATYVSALNKCKY